VIIKVNQGMAISTPANCHIQLSTHVVKFGSAKEPQSQEHVLSYTRAYAYSYEVQVILPDNWINTCDPE
jgi:hypothetical protein